MVEPESVQYQFHMLNYPSAMFPSVGSRVLHTACCFHSLPSVLSTPHFPPYLFPPAHSVFSVFLFLNLVLFWSYPTSQCPPTSFVWPSFHFFNLLPILKQNTFMPNNRPSNFLGNVYSLPYRIIVS